MKIDGIHGDFIVYEKLADKDCPIRISFMKQDKESSKLRAQKVKKKGIIQMNFDNSSLPKLR